MEWKYSEWPTSRCFRKSWRHMVLMKYKRHITKELERNQNCDDPQRWWRGPISLAQQHNLAGKLVPAPQSRDWKTGSMNGLSPNLSVACLEQMQLQRRKHCTMISQKPCRLTGIKKWTLPIALTLSMPNTEMSKQLGALKDLCNPLREFSSTAAEID